MRRVSVTKLTPSAPVVAVTTLAVLLLHVAALSLWPLRFSDEPVRKRPDLTIEFFYSAPMPVDGPVKQTTPQPLISPNKTPVSTDTAKPSPAKPEPSTTQGPTPVATTTQTVAEGGRDTSPSLSETAPVPVALANIEADYKAAYLNNPRPPYPFAAVRQGAEGRVLLSAEVLPDGRAGRVSLEKSSGHNLLDAAALNTVRSWRFTPARKGGVATAQTVSIPIDFNLQDRR
jgi:protein TonB